MGKLVTPGGVSRERLDRLLSLVGIVVREVQNGITVVFVDDLLQGSALSDFSN
jgi:hypothetical protein